MSEEIDLEEYGPWMVLLITLIGGAIRVLLLDYKGIWVDEAFSIWMASQSVGDMLQWVVRIDQHPPLYYLLLHYWIALNGDKAYTVRLLSVLFSTATIPVIYLIGKRLAGMVTGLSAAVLLAFSLFNIYYAQETRMYTLLAFNAAVTIYALVCLLTDPRASRPIGSQFRELVQAWRSPPEPIEPVNNTDFTYAVKKDSQAGWKAWFSRRRGLSIRAVETDLAWITLIVFTAATLYSHNTAVFLPLAANIFVLGLMLFQRAKKPTAPLSFTAPSFKNWAIAQIAILLLWLPWAPSFIKQASVIYQRFWIPKPTWPHVTQVLRSFLITSAPISSGFATVVWVLYVLVFGFALVYFRKNIARFAFLAALFAVPFLGELIVSIWRPIFWDRTLIWLTIPVCLVVAVGIAQLKLRHFVFIMLGILATINLFFTSDYFRYYRKEDWNTAARSVAGYTEKGDLVLFNSNMMVIPFNYYFEPYERYYRLEVVKRGVPQDLFESGILEPQMTEQDVPGLVSLLNEYDRVWLVYSHELYTDPDGLILQTLDSQMKLDRQNNFYGGQVRLYVTP